jgi:hypothetical protein
MAVKFNANAILYSSSEDKRAHGEQENKLSNVNCKKNELIIGSH